MAFRRTYAAGSGYGNDYIDSLVWGGAIWSGGPITYSFGPGSMVVNSDALGISGATSIAWTTNEQSMLRTILQSYANVCDITFSEVPYSASSNIVEWKFASISGGSPGTVVLGMHDVPSNSSSSSLWGAYSTANSYWGSKPGSTGWSTVVHELGHMLGLAHPHDGGDMTDGTVFPGVTGPFDSYGTNNLNQGIWTVMSYNHGWINAPGPLPGTYGDVITPMAFDVKALQLLYGANTTYHTGNDTYILPYTNTAGTGWQCIWDAGGADTISAAAENSGSTINLKAAPLTGPNAGGYASWISGIIGGFTIANGVTIENAIGGSGNDTITGNEVGNVLNGAAGDDNITGGLGDDTIICDIGTDCVWYSYTRSQYTITYAAGTFTVRGLEGADTITGVEYFQFSDQRIAASALVDTTAPTVSVFSPVDGGTNVNVGANVVLTFSEAIQKGTGNIHLHLGSASGAIVESFNAATSNRITILDRTLTIDPTANLSSNTKYFLTFDAGTVKDLAGNSFVGTSTYDFTTGIAPITGTTGNDTLTGTAAADIINGLDGNDLITGAGAVDSMNGGNGSDLYIIAATADHSAAEITDSGTSGIDEVRFSATAASTLTLYAGDTGIESVVIGTGTSTSAISTATSALNINAAAVLNGLSISGNAGANSLTGTAYNDNLTGNAGKDSLKGGAGNDILSGGTGADTLTGGANRDTFVLAAGNSGQASNYDIITDFAKGAAGVGDLIDYSTSLTIGGSNATATSSQASINMATGVASFAAGSGNSISDALNDISSRFTTATNTAGEFAFFKVKNTGNYYLFISDGAAGVTANDVVIQLTGVTSIASVNTTSGDLSII